MTQIARFRHSGIDKLGVVDGQYFIDLTRAYAAKQAAQGAANATALATAILPPDALAFFQGGKESHAALQEAVAFAQGLDLGEALDQGILVDRSTAKVLVPIPNPPKIVCVARNYRKHAEEAGLQVSEIPSCSRGSPQPRSPTVSQSSFPPCRRRSTGRVSWQ